MFVFVPSRGIELRHWHELCHPYFRDIIPSGRMLRWDRLFVYGGLFEELLA